MMATFYYTFKKIFSGLHYYFHVIKSLAYNLLFECLTVAFIKYASKNKYKVAALHVKIFCFDLDFHKIQKTS